MRKYWAEEQARVEKELASYDLSQEKKDELAKRLDVLKTTDMAVIVSPGQNEIPQMKKLGLDIEPHRRRMNESQPPLDERFKDTTDPLRLVFVCAMWLTGFDAPSCSTVYLDKPMRNHTLMQTIARAKSIINTKANGLMEGWFASGWILRHMDPDYHVDYLIERTEGGELTGKIVYLQQKAHAGVKFKDGLAAESMKLKHLRYYAEKTELPVFLVLVDTEESKAWYLFLQKWIDEHVTAGELKGNGKTSVRVPEAQPLGDVPAFLTAVQRSLAYMREKYPGSALAAVGAEERRIMALDPRFLVRMDVVGGKKTFHLIPKESVTATITVTGDNVKLFQEHWETGKPIKAGGAGLFIKGLPAITFHSPEGELAELSIGPGTPLEIQWSMWSEEPNGFRLTLDGTMTVGKSCYLFQGRLKGGPLNVELRLPLQGAADAGRGNMKFSWDYSCWEGNPVCSLSHFDGVYALVRRLTNGERIRHGFHLRGQDIFPGELNHPKPGEPRTFESFDFIQAVRVTAKEFKVNPSLPKLSLLTVDDLAHVRMLTDLATAGTHSRSELGMKIETTLTDIIDPAAVLRLLDNPEGAYRFTKPNQVDKLLGQEVEIGDLEYTLAPARMLLSPEVRARLEAGEKSGFSAEICGTDDATFTVRRIPIGEA